MKQITIGILAHVDAGKTTLSEALLYETGAIRSCGRVDHKNTHLDTDASERERGITIYSKQALFHYNDVRYYLIDTPGHVDFSAETERTLRILDCAVLLISASDGIQSHTETLWNLLEQYKIPVFIFVNKCDLPNIGQNELIRKIKEKLSSDCVDFTVSDYMEEAAIRDERLLELYLSNSYIPDVEVVSLIAKRRLFPCYFGSALKFIGIKELLNGLSRFAPEAYPLEQLSFRVYKIGRDSQGNRLTCIKVTGGELTNRMLLKYRDLSGAETEEKITGIRLYSGERYDSVSSATVGTVCTLTGLTRTYSGQVYGAEIEPKAPLLEPYMSYSVIMPDGTDPTAALSKLRVLQEEDPTLHIGWSERYHEITLRLMGNIQTEVLTEVIQRRFGLNIKVGKGRILYRETIENSVEGIGHYEPLRHYAEVHVLLSPRSSGEGLVITTNCSTDELDLNWQRLILTHCEEKTHLGVLTGSPITDMEICLIAGRAHPKHTEGGDFRQATYRAIRQGLMQAKSVLLEPYSDFTLSVPNEFAGKAIQDFHRLSCSVNDPVTRNDGYTDIDGSGPASLLNDYGNEVKGYTHGRGRFSCIVSRYAPCHNSSEVISALQYDPETDLMNTPDSVFCSHGAGITVKWDSVTDKCHIPPINRERSSPSSRQPLSQNVYSVSERELEAILEREFGPIRRKQYTSPSDKAVASALIDTFSGKNVLIVDGYNLIFASDELSLEAEHDLEHARILIMNRLCSYSGFTGCETLLVFDAYKVKNGRGELFQYKNISVVFTKENETADTYIEKLCHNAGKKDKIRVITSDALIQLSALREGIRRESSREFLEELSSADRIIQKHSGAKQ